MHLQRKWQLWSVLDGSENQPGFLWAHHGDWPRLSVPGCLGQLPLLAFHSQPGFQSSIFMLSPWRALGGDNSRAVMGVCAFLMQMAARTGRAPSKPYAGGAGWGAPSWPGQELPGLLQPPSPAAAFCRAAVWSRSSWVGCLLPSTPVHCRVFIFSHTGVI